ncbi:hypothetical protein [Microbulbifer discodermiae]|uniref:hypothetical protein n=1 Tax=Microbulbifer sp. 2201CG32-9 TaxID=3232309 RepID=UPI00345C47AC
MRRSCKKNLVARPHNQVGQGIQFTLVGQCSTRNHKESEGKHDKSLRTKANYGISAKFITPKLFLRDKHFFISFLSVHQICQNLLDYHPGPLAPGKFIGSDLSSSQHNTCGNSAGQRFDQRFARAKLIKKRTNPPRATTDCPDWTPSYLNPGTLIQSATSSGLGRLKTPFHFPHNNDPKIIR